MTDIVDVHEFIEHFGPRILSAKKIAELALQKIGAFSVNDSAADPVHLARAIDWMDLGVQEFTGTNDCPWLLQRQIEIPLDANTAEYDLQDAMGTQLPPGNVIFPISATLSDADGNELPIQIVDWEEFSAITKKDATGTPCIIYIDRTTPTQKMLVYYVPTVDTYTLLLTVQQYAPDLTRNNGDTAHQMRAEFQLWMVMMTAAHIGGGPVKRLSLQVKNDIASEAGNLRARLAAYSNKPQPMSGEPRRTEAWGA
jgi:hypothetical protein